MTYKERYEQYLKLRDNTKRILHREPANHYYKDVFDKYRINKAIIAYQLAYPPNVIESILKASSEFKVNNILIDTRKELSL